MFPDGVLDIHGMATQNMFYKHLFDKLDIEMQIIRPANNKFKSAVEPYFLDKMSDAAVHFRKVAERLKSTGSLDPKVLNVDTNTLLYQVPGGMLSNLIGQLKQANAMDKYYDVLAEVPVVRKDFGYPPLVTPTSQIVGTQAVMNVIMGERYKTFTKESRAVLRGEYGALPGEVNEEVRAKAGIKPEEVITCRPADLLKPELEEYAKEIFGAKKVSLGFKQLQQKPWELAAENSELLDGITYPDEIPDEMVLEHFKGVCFSCDDFSCTAGQY